MFSQFGDSGGPSGGRGDRRGGGAVTTSLAQSSSGKWWHGYGNGADNSRYFASRQINKSNVNQLQVAWSYPHGET